jgi:plasmid maintenance system antidote protein VapI
LLQRNHKSGIAERWEAHIGESYRRKLMKIWFSDRGLAEILGITRQGVNQKAKNENGNAVLLL